MRPVWWCSSWLMQRISVDLPEPEGPQMTMRSPRRTCRLMLVSAWKLPKLLQTPSRVMMRSPMGTAGLADMARLLGASGRGAPAGRDAPRAGSEHRQFGQWGAQPLAADGVQLAVVLDEVDEGVDPLEQVGLAAAQRD